MKKPPFRKAHKLVGDLSREIEEKDREIERLRELVRRRDQELADADAATDAATKDTHERTDPTIAEYVILLEHAVERHKTVEAERDALRRERDEAGASLNAMSAAAEDWRKQAFAAVRDNAKKQEAPAAPPPGYEHLTPAAIAGIRSTVQTQADRAGQTQDEVFEAKISNAAMQQMRMQEAETKRRLAIRARAERFVSTEPPPAKDDAQ